MSDPAEEDIATAPITTIEECVATLCNVESGPRLCYHAALRIAKSDLSTEAKAMTLIGCLDRAPADKRYPIILALGRVDHELTACKLRALVADSEDGNRYAALKGLARLKDPTMIDRCRNEILHGNERERIEGVILLGILDTPDALSAIEGLWHSSDIDHGQRVLIGLHLAEVGSHVSVPFLIGELRDIQNDICRPSAEWEIRNGVAVSDNEVRITFALASLRIPCGLLNLKGLLGTNNPYKLEWIRRLCWKALGVSPVPVEDWITRAVACVDEQMGQGRAGDAPQLNHFD